MEVRELVPLTPLTRSFKTYHLILLEPGTVNSYMSVSNKFSQGDLGLAGNTKELNNCIMK